MQKHTFRKNPEHRSQKSWPSFSTCLYIHWAFAQLKTYKVQTMSETLSLMLTHSCTSTALRTISITAHIQQPAGEYSKYVHRQLWSSIFEQVPCFITSQPQGYVTSKHKTILYFMDTARTTNRIWLQVRPSFITLCQEQVLHASNKLEKDIYSNKKCF